MPSSARLLLGEDRADEGIRAPIQNEQMLLPPRCLPLQFSRIIPLALPLFRPMIAFMELVIALLVIGALLVLAETILPGMVAGILGCICLLGGVIAGYVKFDVRTGNYILLGVVAAMIAGTVLWLKIFPKTRLARLFISENSVGNLGAPRPEPPAQGRARGAGGHQGRPGPAPHPRRRVDDLRGGTGHPQSL